MLTKIREYLTIVALALAVIIMALLLVTHDWRELDEYTTVPIKPSPSPVVTR